MRTNHRTRSEAALGCWTPLLCLTLTLDPSLSTACPCGAHEPSAVWEEGCSDGAWGQGGRDVTAQRKSGANRQPAKDTLVLLLWEPCLCAEVGSTVTPCRIRCVCVGGGAVRHLRPPCPSMYMMVLCCDAATWTSFSRSRRSPLPAQNGVPHPIAADKLAACRSGAGWRPPVGAESAAIVLELLRFAV